MAGRKPIEKRLMKIEQGILEIQEKLCEIQPCNKDEVVADESTAEADSDE